MTTYERWLNNRPVKDSLPGINGSYDNQVSDWVSAPPDEVLSNTKRLTIDEGLRQIDPLKCDVEWLDFLADLSGWYGYWDTSWPETSKRQLLANSYSLIWPNYGSSKCLSFVLQALAIPHLIQQGQSFLIGVSQVGDPIGAAAWEYDIVLPTNLFNSPEARLTQRINRLFGPCWCKSRILFSDEYFDAQGFLLIQENTLFSVDDDQTVLEL